MNINNFESRIQSVLEQFIIYLYDEYNHLIYLYEMEKDDDDDDEIKDFDYEYITNSIESCYLNTNDDFNRNLEKIDELFTEHFDEATGKQLIYDNYKEHLEDLDYNAEDIQGLLDELAYNLEDLYDYFVNNVFFKNEEFIRTTIDSLNNQPILK